MIFSSGPDLALRAQATSLPRSARARPISFAPVARLPKQRLAGRREGTEEGGRSAQRREGVYSSAGREAGQRESVVEGVPP